MFTTAIGLRGQAKHEERVPAKAMRLAAVLGTLILVGIAVNALIIVAAGTARPSSAVTVGCAAIRQTVHRPACEDKLAGKPVPHPFKGANAPVRNASL
jgi:hypothetical protein